METPFYMIFLEGANAPAKKHLTFEEAEEEAKRLSKLYCKKAFILCTLQVVICDIFRIEICLPELPESEPQPEA